MLLTATDDALDVIWAWCIHHMVVSTVLRLQSHCELSQVESAVEICVILDDQSCTLFLSGWNGELHTRILDIKWIDEPSRIEVKELKYDCYVEVFSNHEIDLGQVQVLLIPDHLLNISDHCSLSVLRQSDVVLRPKLHRLLSCRLYLILHRSLLLCTSFLSW